MCVFLAIASVLPTANAEEQAARTEADFVVTTVKEGMDEPLASIDELVMPKVGRVLRYRELMNGDEPFVYDEILTGLKHDGKVRSLRYIWTEVDPAQGEEALRGEEIMRLDDGLWLLNDQGPERSGVFSPGLLEIPTDLRPGAEQRASYESLTRDGAEEFHGNGELRYRVLGTATVETPAGVFEDCIRLSFQERFEEDGEILNSSGDDYLKPGIGLVRRVVRNLDGSTVTELIAIDPES